MGSGTKWLRPLVSHLKTSPSGLLWGNKAWMGTCPEVLGGRGVETCGPAPPLSHTPEFVFSVISSSHDPHSTCVIMLWGVFRVCVYVCTREGEGERDREGETEEEREGERERMQEREREREREIDRERDRGRFFASRPKAHRSCLTPTHRPA